MSDWITDRLPTAEDALDDGRVWVTCGTAVLFNFYHYVTLGTPWMPVPRPVPYVKPKRWRAEWVHRRPQSKPFWALTDGNGYYDRLPIPSINDDVHREAAEKIVVIVNEVFP